MSMDNVHPLMREVLSNFAPKQRLCEDHAHEYWLNYGESATVVEQDSCEKCTRHQTGCICADCSGAELTADND